MHLKENWRTFNGKYIDGDILERIEKAIEREINNGYRLKVCIGSDSQKRGNSIEYASVIVILREGKGGFMFIKNSYQTGEVSIKERMLNEVSKSIDIAYKLCDTLDKYDVDLEVHADINTNPQFKSNTALSEAMGYILSMGFTFKAKPNAFASSVCADKFI